MLSVKNKMIIYRIENSQGIGPFHGLFSHKLYGTDKYNAWIKHSKSLPSAIVEFGSHLTLTPYYVCGCQSLDDLMVWFEEFLPELNKFGYSIRQYDVDEENILIGAKQVMFVKPVISDDL